MLKNERIEETRKALGLNKKVLLKCWDTQYLKAIGTILIEINHAINAHWILTGKGDMLISSDGNSRSSSSDNVDVLKNEIQHLNDKLKDKEKIIRLMKHQS